MYERLPWTATAVDWIDLKKLQLKDPAVPEIIRNRIDYMFIDIQKKFNS